MSTWRHIKFKELSVQIIDGDRSSRYPKREEMVDAGYLFLNTTNVQDDSLDLSQVNFVTPEKFSQITKGRLQPLDIVMTTRGSIGKVALFNDTNYRTGLINAQMLILRADDRHLSPPYLFNLVRSKGFQDQLRNYASGSAQPQIPIRDLREIPVYVPDLKTQRKIASVLSAYDDLIENNTRRIAILEEMAQMLYREWFVHFRFPGHEEAAFEEVAGFGRIPAGWQVGKVSDFVTLQSGFAFKSKTYDASGKYGLVTISNVKDGQFDPNCRNRIATIPDNMPQHCLLQPGDLLLSLTGNIGRVCQVIGDDFLLNQRVAKLVPSNGTGIAFVCCAFREDYLQHIMNQIATGVAQQNLSPVKTGKLPFLMPPSELVTAFDEMAGLMFAQRVVLEKKNTNLRQTRDLLLPRLISGELDISHLDIATPNPVV